MEEQGVRVWLDTDQMRGSLNVKMCEGIASSATILIFITENYLKKASGYGPNGEDDNCFFGRRD